VGNSQWFENYLLKLKYFYAAHGGGYPCHGQGRMVEMRGIAPLSRKEFKIGLQT